MNRELLLRVADAIEREPDSYDQATSASYRIQTRDGNIKDISPQAARATIEGLEFLPHCGTAYCIAGHVTVQAGYAYNLKFGWWEAGDGTYFYDGGQGLRAKELLGLSEPQASVLFNADWVPAEGLTVPEALRAFADGAKLSGLTGPIMWSDWDWNMSELCEFEDDLS